MTRQGTQATATMARLHYDAYEQALQILRSDHISVPERKAAIFIRDEFEACLRAGMFRDLFTGEAQS